MYYKQNDHFDFIIADNTSLAVFAPDTGAVHFFDETGIDILNILSVPHTLQELLDKLCEVYTVEPATIFKDVEEFLAEAVSKRVICILNV